MRLLLCIIIIAAVPSGTSAEGRDDGWVYGRGEAWKAPLVGSSQKTFVAAFADAAEQIAMQSRIDIRGQYYVMDVIQDNRATHQALFRTAAGTRASFPCTIMSEKWTTLGVTIELKARRDEVVTFMEEIKLTEPPSGFFDRVGSAINIPSLDVYAMQGTGGAWRERVTVSPERAPDISLEVSLAQGQGELPLGDDGQGRLSLAMLSLGGRKDQMKEGVRGFTGCVWRTDNGSQLFVMASPSDIWNSEPAIDFWIGAEARLTGNIVVRAEYFSENDGDPSLLAAGKAHLVSVAGQSGTCLSAEIRYILTSNPKSNLSLIGRYENAARDIYGARWVKSGGVNSLKQYHDSSYGEIFYFGIGVE